MQWPLHRLKQYAYIYIYVLYIYVLSICMHLIWSDCIYLNVSKVALTSRQVSWNMQLFVYISIHIIPVVPGQAGGGSFQKEKNYIAQKEFAYRMCARRPTSAMPKSFLCCERTFCSSIEVKCFDVLMSVAGSGHVMVTSFDAMWWLVLCHVTWCNVMSWW